MPRAAPAAALQEWMAWALEEWERRALDRRFAPRAELPFLGPQELTRLGLPAEWVPCQTAASGHHRLQGPLQGLDPLELGAGDWGGGSLAGGWGFDGNPAVPEREAERIQGNAEAAATPLPGTGTSRRPTQPRRRWGFNGDPYVAPPDAPLTTSLPGPMVWDPDDPIAPLGYSGIFVPSSGNGG